MKLKQWKLKKPSWMAFSTNNPAPSHPANRLPDSVAHRIYGLLSTPNQKSLAEVSRKSRAATANYLAPKKAAAKKIDQARAREAMKYAARTKLLLHKGMAARKAAQLHGDNYLQSRGFTPAIMGGGLAYTKKTKNGLVYSFPLMGSPTVAAVRTPHHIVFAGHNGAITTIMPIKANFETEPHQNPHPRSDMRLHTYMNQHLLKELDAPESVWIRG